MLIPVQHHTPNLSLDSVVTRGMESQMMPGLATDSGDDAVNLLLAEDMMGRVVICLFYDKAVDDLLDLCRGTALSLAGDMLLESLPQRYSLAQVIDDPKTLVKSRLGELDYPVKPTGSLA